MAGEGRCEWGAVAVKGEGKNRARSTVPTAVERGASNAGGSHRWGELGISLCGEASCLGGVDIALSRLFKLHRIAVRHCRGSRCRSSDDAGIEGLFLCWTVAWHFRHDRNSIGMLTGAFNTPPTFRDVMMSAAP